MCADHASTTNGDRIPAEVRIYRTMLEAARPLVRYRREKLAGIGGCRRTRSR